MFQGHIMHFEKKKPAIQYFVILLSGGSLITLFSIVGFVTLYLQKKTLSKF